MQIATFNVNGVNGRLSAPLRWLEDAGRDVGSRLARVLFSGHDHGIETTLSAKGSR